MKANEIIKIIMRNHGIKQLDLAVSMGGENRQSAVSGALNRDMKSSTIVKLLNFMNCELVIRDNKTKEEYIVSEQ